MSQYYEMGDRTLWNPSNGASQLFIGQVNLYETMLGLASGIGPVQADECRIDPTVFGAFANALLAWYCRTGHAVMTALSEGFVATVLVLAQRADIEVIRRPTDLGELGDVRDVQATMAPVLGAPQAAAPRLRAHELGLAMPT
ncbi:DUF6086 family protein [Embleya sp. NPDC020630]|uniref:DUF6086 family protein n=1 Tax=Embleya sp. NPDC020630 TaxID=3363979 RepID=UPI0037BE0D0B